ncbi:MAG: hypothetical protein V7750_04195 [Sneathiella sp.]
MPKILRSHLANRSLLRLTGTDVKSFLQNLITNDIEKLSSNSAIYSALLTPQGKFLHDFFIIEWANEIYLDCLKDRSADLIKKLSLYKLRADVKIEDTSEGYNIFAYYSQNSAVLMEHLKISTDTNTIAYPDPRNEGLGFRVISGADISMPNADVIDADLVSYTKHRLSLGIPEGGSDIIPEKNFLLETNFEELNGVSFSKGCYVGQELTARTKHRAKIKKRLFQFTFDGDIAINDIISSDGVEIATVCAFESPYGLAITRLSQWEKALQTGTKLEPLGLSLDKPEYVILPPQEN